MRAPIGTIVTGIIEVIKVVQDQARDKGEPVSETLAQTERELTDWLADEANRRAGGDQ